jgi:hypothetical protein
MMNLFNWVSKLNSFFTFSFGGDAPAPAPTQTTVQNTNIPEYAQPYVENMLNAAQAQIYNPSGTGFNKYTPYASDPSKYVAGFSPLQMMSQSGTAGLRLPDQYAAATGQAMGATGQMGMLAPQMGMAGSNYARQATSPAATAAYMNPYLSASLDPMMAEARRQYDITGQQQKSAATGARAFGGSREAIMAAENERNKNTALNQMLGQGYNTAFQQAQQAQQFGANLGLQGQQGQLAALQGQLGGAGQLGQLGSQQLAGQQGILGAQAQAGATQQQNQQQIINQAIQNYATEQQYPYMQLGTLNAMLRGLPMNQMSTQTYQAAPSMVSQLGGLGSAAIGAYGALNKGAKGGLMETEKYAPGGAIPIRHYSQDQLQRTLKSPFSSPLADIAATGTMQENAYTRANPTAVNSINQMPMTPPQQPPMGNPLITGQPPEIRAGLAAVGTDDMTQMAGGGLLAFADEGLVPVDEDTFQMPKDKKGEIDWEAAIAKQLGTRSEGKLAKQQREALETGIKERDMSKLDYALMKGGFKAMQSTSPYALAGIGAGGEEFTNELQRVGSLNDADRKELMKQSVEAEKADDARRAQMLGYGLQADTAKKTKQLQLAQLNATQANTKDAKEAANQIAYEKLWQDSIVKNAQSIRSAAAKNMQDIDEATVQREAYRQTYDALKNTPGFKKYLTGVEAPGEAPAPVAPPPPEPGFMDKAGNAISNIFGGSKVVNFDAQGNRIK